MASKERSKDGTGINGKFYEREIALWIALKCLSDNNIKDFWILGNPSGVDKFDDIVLHVEYRKKGKEVFFFQLKHKEVPVIEFQKTFLQGKKNKNFDLKIYEKDYCKVTENEDLFLKKHDIDKECKKYFSIYTNYKKPEEAKDTKSIYDIKPVATEEINDIANSSSESNSIYKIVDLTDLRNRMFLEEFYLWLDQIDERDILGRISSEFAINKTVVDSLSLFFVRRFEPSGSDEKFTRRDMIQKMLEIFFENYHIPEISGYPLNKYDKSLNILNIINSYNATVIKQKISEITIWGAIIEKIRRDFQNDELEKNYLSLVCELKVPFFIKTSHPLFESFQSYFLDAVCISVVIFLDSQLKVPLNKDERKILQYVTDLPDDSIKPYSSHLPKVSFQGKEEIDLIEFVKGYRKPSHLLDIDVFFKYFDTTIQIGRTETALDFYIHRKIKVPVMKLEDIIRFDEVTRDSCTQIFCNCSEEKGISMGLTNLPDYMSRKHKSVKKYHFFSVTSFQPSLIKDVYDLSEGRNQHLHIFEKINNVNDYFIPVYREGFGECNISKKITFVTVEDETIADFCQQNKVNIICNNAGEGKTMLLKYVSTRFPADIWVLDINMSNSSLLSIAKDFKNFIQEIYNTERRNTSEKYEDVFQQLYNISKEKQKFIWLVDDFEEIGSESLNGILREIHVAGIRIWITSRPFKKADLENDFKINAMELIAINPEEQTKFFENYFEKCNETESVAKVLKNIENIRKNMDQTFIGVFQQMTLLAEIFNTTRQLSDLEYEQYEIIDVYQRFIDIKVNAIPEHHQNMVKIIMKKIAMTHFFSYPLLQSYFDVDELCAQMKFFDREYRKGSIITHIKENDGPLTIERFRAIFTHETYAEFLAAQWLAEKVETVQMELLYIPKLRTLRYFFDSILTKNLPMLSAAVNKRYDLMHNMFKRDQNNILQEDILGRTVLHFLIGNEPQFDIHPNLFALKQPNEHAVCNIIDEVVELLLPIPKEHLSQEGQLEMWMKRYQSTRINVLREPFFDIWFQVLNQFILASGSLALLNRLLPNERITLPNLVEEQNYLLLAHSIMNNFNNILKRMDLSNLKISKVRVMNYFSMSLLHLSIIANNWEGFQTLLKIENQLEKWNTDQNDNNVFHLACTVTDKRFLTTLCMLGKYSGEFLNQTNTSGQSSLHGFCWLQPDLWINEVIDTPGLDLELSCKKGITPFIISILSENFKTAEVLLEREVDINHQNQFGLSALHYTCMNNLCKSAEFLIKWKANINIKNNDGHTPLFFAVNNEHLDIVHLLIKHKANINSVDKHGSTVLHLAVHNSNASLIELLVKNGAKTRKRNKKHQTPFILACLTKKLNAVKVLLPYETQQTLQWAFSHARKIHYDELEQIILQHRRAFRR